MKHLLPLLLLLAFHVGASGEEAAPDDPAIEQIHDQLRLMRERMFEAYEKRDVDALLEGVEDNVVVTWQNGDRVLNHAEFVAFYDKMLTGDNPTVKDVSSEFTVDGISLIYGDDTAVAYGTCVDHFALSDGSSLDLTSKWTATVVANEGNWKVASFHISASIFDNPILDVAKGWLVKAGIIGGIVGLILGFLIASMIRKKKGVSSD